MTAIRKQKVSKACDSCKSRKKKCDGSLPCPSCIGRNIDCTYTMVDKRRTRYEKSYNMDTYQKTTEEKHQHSHHNGHSHSESHIHNHNPVSHQFLNASSEASSPDRLDGRSSPLKVDINKIPVSLRLLLNFSSTDGDEKKQNDANKQNIVFQKSQSSASSTPSSNSPFESKLPPLYFTRSDGSKSTQPEDPEKLAAYQKFKIRVHKMYHQDSEVEPSPALESRKLKWDHVAFYIGPSSPISLVYVSRSILEESPILNLKDSSFCKERHFIQPKHNFPDPSSSTHQLPLRSYTDFVVDLYLKNMNQLIYIVEPVYIKQVIINELYTNPMDGPKEYLCLLNFLLGLGSLYTRAQEEFSEFPFPKVIDPGVFINNGLAVMNSLPPKITMWKVMMHLALGVYYLNSNDPDQLWIQMGIAKHNGELIGLNIDELNEYYLDVEMRTHRRKLWRTILVSDSILSVLLGRTLTIAHDQREMGCVRIGQETGFVEECHYQTARISAALAQTYHYMIQRKKEFEFSHLKRLLNSIKQWAFLLPFELKASSLKEFDSMYWKNTQKQDNETRYAYSPLYLCYFSACYAASLLGMPCYQFAIQRVLHHHQMSSADYNRKPELGELTSNSLIKFFAEGSHNLSKFFIRISAFLFNSGLRPDKPFTFTSYMLYCGLTVGLLYHAQVAIRTSTRSLNGPPAVAAEFAFMNDDNEQLLLTAISSLRTFARVDHLSNTYLNVLVNMYGSIKKAENNGLSQTSSEVVSKQLELKNLEDCLYVGLELMDEASQASQMRLLNEFQKNLNASGKNNGAFFDGSF